MPKISDAQLSRLFACARELEGISNSLHVTDGSLARSVEADVRNAWQIIAGTLAEIEKDGE